MKVRSKKENDNKLPLIALLIVACVGLTIGYSALSTTLSIKGTASIEGMSWRIEFQNLGEATLTGNASIISNPVISEDKTEISSYNVNFLDPGDSVSYTFQIANNGTLNAKLSEIIRDTITCEGYGNSVQATNDADNVCANLEYTLKYQEEEPHYSDDYVLTSTTTDIEVNDILNAGDVKNMILTLKYKSPTDSETITEPEDDVSIAGLGIKLIYSQNNQSSSSTPVTPPTPDEPINTVSFAEDSWSTIAKAVTAGQTDNYHVGDEKDVNLGDTYGTHKVRISNMSTPDECNQNGFSQSACGFVVEFTDIITTHYMNSINTNKGGWPGSDMYKFLNDNSLNGESGKELSIINSLPPELKNVIIDTKTVSGSGKENEDPEYFTSKTDKLYLLAPKEIYSDWSNQYDKAKDKTRQLDYYKIKGVTTNRKDWNGAIKKDSAGTAKNWWLRSAYSYNYKSFYYIYGSGDWNGYDANYANGVSPAFRLE